MQEIGYGNLSVASSRLFHAVCGFCDKGFDQSINWLELDYVDATLFSRCKLQFVNKQNIGKNSQ